MCWSMFGFRSKAWFGKVNFENGYSCATMRINKKCWRVKKFEPDFGRFSC